MSLSKSKSKALRKPTTQAGQSKPAGIKEIAKALGISIGTVDRALHGRKGVSPVTQEQVLKMAKRLNYVPNLAARNLKLNRQLRVGVFLPEEITYFFDALRDGIRFAQRTQLGGNIELVFHSYPFLGQKDIETMERGKWQNFDGLILAPGDAAKLAPVARKAVELKKPMLFVATDAARLPRLASVTTDSTISGGIAADLLGRLISNPGAVAVFTGNRKIQDHSEKLRGFAASLATLSPHLNLLPAIETHESAKSAYENAVKLLEAQKNLAGVYISTANSLPVLQAIKELRKPGSIQVIATDLYPELASLIESGYVAASLYQRPFTQGRMAFELLHNYLSSGEEPKKVTRLAPHIVLRSNLSLFADAMEREESDK